MDDSKIITANFTRHPTLSINTELEGMVEDGFRMTLIGEFGQAYSILGSTNFLDWAEVGRLTNTYGIIQFTDTLATNLPSQFYQARTVEQ